MYKQPFRDNRRSGNLSFKSADLPLVGSTITINLGHTVVTKTVESWMINSAKEMVDFITGDRYWLMPYSAKSSLVRNNDYGSGNTSRR